MRRRVALAIALAPLAIAFGAAFACGGSRVPLPEYGEHPESFPEARCVPWPPPPAKPEQTGAPPSERSVWVDGEWVWNGRGTGPRSYVGEWDWKPGGWVEPPFGATFARSKLERLPGGALAWYPGHWHLPAHYARDAAVLDAAAPVSSANVLLECPPPPTAPAIAVTDAPDATDATDATGADAPTDVREGPAVVYPPDAFPAPEPKVVPDAEIPADTKKPPELIQPPE